MLKNSRHISWQSTPCTGASQCLFMHLSILLQELVQTGSRSQRGQMPEIVLPSLVSFTLEVICRVLLKYTLVTRRTWLAGGGGGIPLGSSRTRFIGSCSMDEQITRGRKQPRPFFWLWQSRTVHGGAAHLDGVWLRHNLAYWRTSSNSISGTQTQWKLHWWRWQTNLFPPAFI